MPPNSGLARFRPSFGPLLQGMNKTERQARRDSSGDLLCALPDYVCRTAGGASGIDHGEFVVLQLDVAALLSTVEVGKGAILDAHNKRFARLFHFIRAVVDDHPLH